MAHFHHKTRCRPPRCCTRFFCGTDDSGCNVLYSSLSPYPRATLVLLLPNPKFCGGVGKASSTLFGAGSGVMAAHGDDWVPFRMRFSCPLFPSVCGEGWQRDVDVHSQRRFPSKCGGTQVVTRSWRVERRRRRISVMFTLGGGAKRHTLYLPCTNV